MENEIKIIVSTDAFGNFLKRSINGLDYIITSDEKNIRFKDVETDDVKFMPVELKGNLTGIRMEYKNIKKLWRFLLSIPNQPIVISFSDNNCVCSQFVSEFRTKLI